MKDYSKTIETERLLLRKFESSDATDIFTEYASHDIVTKFLTWKPHKTIEDTKTYLKTCVLPKYDEPFTYRWAIVLKETKKVIGCIDVVKKDMTMLMCEIGCVIGEKYWGKGIMTEAGKVVVKYLLEEGFKRIQSYAHTENIGSRKMLQKIGMKTEGVLPKFAKDRDGNLVDVIMHALEV